MLAGNLFYSGLSGEVKLCISKPRPRYFITGQGRWKQWPTRPALWFSCETPQNFFTPPPKKCLAEKDF